MGEKEPRWFKFWKRSNEEQLKAISALTEAIVELQKVRQEGNSQLIAMFSSPEQLALIMRQAMEVAQGAPPRAMQAVPTTGTQPRLALPAPEEIQAAVDIVLKAVMSKMEQMEKHIAGAVADLPPSTVKAIADNIKRGEDFTLRRKSGCIHIDFGYGDAEFYLKL